MLLQKLVKITKGRHYRDMRVDEMRSVTRAEGFPGEVLLKTKQIDDLEKMMRSLTIESIRTNLRNDAYLSVSSRYGHHNHTGRGAMCLIITKEDTYQLRRWSFEFRSNGPIWTSLGDVFRFAKQ
mmetsp:Transcript_13091/g.19974  ORF Transcript_13091/g.19974 Transcript_13091/m.19974 type:complete len:124 (+) Transcript_13091:569-940(+)